MSNNLFEITENLKAQRQIDSISSRKLGILMSFIKRTGGSENCSSDSESLKSDDLEEKYSVT